jgi:hypothetical protein
MNRSVWCAVFALALVVPTMALAKHDHDKRGRGLADTTVLIIRHAEKPDSGAGLTPAGEARAQAYVGYFEHFSLNGQPMRPDWLVAAADSKQSMRPRLTIEPLSQALNLPIDDRFSDKQAKDLADALRSENHGSIVLICWHHGEIPKLIHELGADAAALIAGDKWPPSVFGWVVVLHYDHQGNLVPGSAQVIPEHLMPDDQ